MPKSGAETYFANFYHQLGAIGGFAGLVDYDKEVEGTCLVGVPSWALKSSPVFLGYMLSWMKEHFVFRAYEFIIRSVALS